MRDTQPEDVRSAEGFMAAAADELAALGVQREIIAPWLTARKARVARLTVHEMYIQTPGQMAGMRKGGSAA